MLFKQQLCKDILVFIYVLSLLACNNKPKDSIEKADSANKALLDTALKNDQQVVDPKSADFMVRFYDVARTEREMAGTAMHLGVVPRIKDFAATIYQELGTMLDSMQSLRMRKNIVLPSTISDEGQAEIKNLKDLRGEKMDRRFLSYVIQTHEKAAERFKEAVENTKDEDIRSFADISAIIFKKYLNTAKTIL